MILGVDLGGTNIRAGLESEGVIRHQRKDFFQTQGSLDDTLHQFIEFIRPLVTNEVKGIGIGVPSVVDVQRGIVYNVYNIPSWETVPLKTILEDEFDVPVCVNNDVNCFTLGEHRFGQARGRRNVVGLACGTGLGAGIIINDELVVGSNCGAGEIGLLPYRDQTLEYYASGNFFSAIYNTTAEATHAKAIQNDTQALAIWEEFGLHIGQAVKNVILTYDPETVVLGGSVCRAFRYFEYAMRESLRDFQYPESIKRLEILQSQDENISLLGAAALMYNKKPVVSRV